MGRIIDEVSGKIEKVKDGEPITEACKKLGIPFSCTEGVCGTCIMEVVEGKENLSPINELESDLGADETYRFACQCKLKKGDVKIKF